MGSETRVGRAIVAAVVTMVLAASCTGGGRSVEPAERVIAPTAASSPTPAAAAPIDLEPGWQALDPGPLAGRIGHAAVWTGSEVLIWGGRNDDGALDDGAAFDPATGTWRLLAPTRFAGRAWPVAVWTGQEMVVIGGVGSSDRSLSGAAAYDPVLDSWREVDLAWSAVSPLSGAVWTGDAVVVVGAVPPPTGDPSADVIALDPVEGIVSALTPYGEPARRAVAVRWDGSSVITATIDAGADAVVRSLDPLTGAVVEETTLDGVSGLDVAHAAVAVDDQLVVVPVHYDTGAIVDAGTASGIPASGSVTRWPASVVGSLISYGDTVFDLATRTWVDTPLPDQSWDREFPIAVSTGDAVVVWGGDACGRAASCAGLVQPEQTLVWVPSEG